MDLLIEKIKKHFYINNEGSKVYLNKFGREYIDKKDYYFNKFIMSVDVADVENPEPGIMYFNKTDDSLYVFSTIGTWCKIETI